MRVNSYTLAKDGSDLYRLKYPAKVLQAQGLDIQYLETGGETRDADVLVFNRPASKKAVEVIAKLSQAGYAIVVDVDDLFSHVRPGHALYGERAQLAHAHLKWACKLATLVTATTPIIAEEYGGARGRVVPNYIPDWYLSLSAAPLTDPVRIGWSGTVSSHPNDLQVVGDAVQRLVSSKVCSVAYVGPHPEASRVREALKLKAKPATSGWMDFRQYPVAMSQLGVGIVPLEACTFNDAKSWLKGLELAAVGVPFVASPAAEYKKLYTHGAGKLAERPNEWRRLIADLAKPGAYRDDAIGAGRRAAEALTLKHNAHRWAEVFTEANSLRPAKSVLA